MEDNFKVKMGSLQDNLILSEKNEEHLNSQNIEMKNEIRELKENAQRIEEDNYFQMRKIKILEKEKLEGDYIFTHFC